jgi:HK97 family phage prohead protease
MRKVFNLDIKSYTDDEDERKFNGYGSTFGNVDRVGDIVMKGAFAKSLEKHREEGSMPSLLLHHDMKRPIGVWTQMEEDDSGLFVEGKLTKGVRDADEAYNLLKDGALHSMSIGYRVVREEYDRKQDANLLHEIALHEVSLVTIPANASAVVGTVKDCDGNPDVRELERILRDAGLSRRESKAFISEGLKGLTGNPVEGVASESIVAETAGPTEAELAALDRKNAIDELLNSFRK